MRAVVKKRTADEKPQLTMRIGNECLFSLKTPTTLGPYTIEENNFQEKIQKMARAWRVGSPMTI